MSQEIKRRIFLYSIAAGLIGLPITAFFLGRKKGASESHRFSKLLKQYQTITDVPIVPIETPATFGLALNPPVGSGVKYVIYSPSFFPEELSSAIGQEPDLFFIRDGELSVSQNHRGQVLISGGDQIAGLVSPFGEDLKAQKDVLLYVKDGRLRNGKPKGTANPPHVDTILAPLLALDIPANLRTGTLSTGTKWKGTSGRIKPFEGYTTQYEGVGFANVGGRKTVNIRFEGTTPNIVGLPGVTDEPQEKGAVLTTKHKGNCYFDCGTGLLVRQEAELETFNSKIQGFKAKDGSSSMLVKTQFVLQVYA